MRKPGHRFIRPPSYPIVVKITADLNNFIWSGKICDFDMSSGLDVSSVTIIETDEEIRVGNYKGNKLVIGEKYLCHPVYNIGDKIIYLVDNQATFKEYV